MKDTNDFPGLLGLTSKGVIAIHADWPMYPVEHGPEVALASLCAFPRGTVLRALDDIDMCLLLIAGDARAKDPLSEQNFHVALWHEDLIQIAKEGLVERAEGISEYEWQRRRFEALGLGKSLGGALYFEDARGNLVPIRPEDLVSGTPAAFAAVKTQGLVVSDAGWERLSAIAQRDAHLLNAGLRTLVDPLVQVARYDTAVRDGCVLLETKLRSLLGASAGGRFGQDLVAELTDRMEACKRFIPAQVKILRGELRTVFKFVRNEFAHNLVTITRPQCYALLVRLSGLLDAIDSIRLDDGQGSGETRADS